MKKYNYLIEILGFLVVLTVVNLIWAGDNLGFVGITPHPYWIPVLALAVKYDLRSALASIAISSGFYIFFLIFFHNLSPVQLGDFQYFKPILLFAIVGGFVGQVRATQKQKYEQLQRDQDQLRAKYETLKKRSQEVVRLKNELADRIIGQTSTVSTVYKLAKKLNVLDPEQLMPAALEFVGEVVGAEKCSFYKWDSINLCLNLEATSGWLQNDYKRYQSNIHNELNRGALTKQRTVALTESFDQELEDAPETIEADVVMSAPVFCGGDKTIYGVLNVEKIPFLKFSPDSIRLFSVIAEWVSQSLTQSMNVRQEDSQANKSEQFNRYIEEMFQGPYQFGTDLSEMRHQ